MSPRAGLTTERVVDAAATIAQRDGLSAVTLASVATELGVRPPSLYNHVGGLDDLRRHLTLRALRELGDRMQKAAVGRTSADAVVAIARAYRSFAEEHPGLYAATVPTSEVADDEVRSLGDEIVETVAAALRGYDLDGDDAIHATRCVRAAVHGFVSLEASGGFGIDVDVDESFEWLVKSVTAGIAARAGRDVAP